MHLIATLAAGISSAAAGMCVLKKRGTSSNATYYFDFEASQQYSASPITLDSQGAVEVYVNELVDVSVYDMTGALVLQFTAGSAAPAIEVISQSFTGVSYTDGSSGTSKPTTLQKVLDAWLVSSGSADFNVLVGGVATSVQTAVAGLSGLFYNVKTYGAIGNGAADDSVGIQAAYSAAAANATSGATVFFPPGTYRYTATINVPAGVKTLGSGGRSSKVAVDGVALSFGFQFATGAAFTACEGLWFGSLTAFPGIQAYVPAGATGEIEFKDCTFGSDVLTQGRLLQSDSIVTSAELRATGCYFDAVAGAVTSVYALGRALFLNCSFVNSQNRGITHLSIYPGAEVVGCRFRAPSATVTGTSYITAYEGGSTSGTLYDKAIPVSHCTFDGNTLNSAGTVALRHSGAAGLAASDFFETHNDFNYGSQVVPYAYTNDGYATATAACQGYHGTRAGRFIGYLNNAATITIEAKIARQIGLHRSAAGAQAISADNGRMGDRLTLTIWNDSGGAVSPSLAAPFLPRSGYSASIANNSTRVVEFIWQSTILFAGGGWAQVGTEVTI